MYAIELRNVLFRRGAFTLKTSIGLPKNQLSVILGPSGSGKTTLLDICAGFITPDSGQVFHGDKEVTLLAPEKRKVGVVFQDHALFPHLTVLDNVAFGPRMRGASSVRARITAQKMLELVSLETLANMYPTEISGGEKQRVSIARALATQPDIFLLDEPFSSLDASLRLKLRREVRRIIRDAGVSALLVTHDQDEAMAMADYLAVMNRGQIVSQGEPSELWLEPKEGFTASFLGRRTLLDIQGLHRGDDGTLLAETAAGRIPIPQSDDSITLPALMLIKSESLRCQVNGSLRGKLIHCEYSDLGWRLELQAEHAGENDVICALWRGAIAPNIGEFLSFDVDTSGMRIIPYSAR